MFPRRFAGLLAVVSFLVLSGAAPPAKSSIRGIGVIGDSYSDEYRDYAPDRSRARNWVEFLADARSLPFGPLADAPRPEPRNRGYAYNWARSAATTDDMIASGQHTGLADQVRDGEVDVVVIFIGGNDFIAASRSPDPISAFRSAADSASANLRRAIAAIREASDHVGLIVFTVPDIRDLPDVRETTTWTSPTSEAYAASLRLFNARVRAMVQADPRAFVVDLEVANRVSNLMSPTRLVVADRSVIRHRPDNAPDHLFLADRRHLGTIGQGMIAKMVVEKLNGQFGAGIAPVTESEIVSFAAKVWSGSPSLAGGQEN